MRRIALYIFLVVFTIALAHAGGHRHLAADSAPSCAACTLAGQGLAPAPTAPAPVVSAEVWVEATRPLVVPRADGRETYRFAPKVSPPASSRA